MTIHTRCRARAMKTRPRGPTFDVFTMSDANLIEAWEHRAKLVSIALGVLKNRDDARDDAEDVVSRFFTKCIATHCLDQFQGRAKFTSYLHRCVYREALMAI